MHIQPHPQTQIDTHPYTYMNAPPPKHRHTQTTAYTQKNYTHTVTQEWQRWVRVNVYKAKDVQMQASQVQPSSGGVHKRMEEHGDGVKE